MNQQFKYGYFKGRKFWLKPCFNTATEFMGMLNSRFEKVCSFNY